MGYSFTVTITSELLDRFVAVSQDVSPLHVDRRFARGRGYPDRVVHGAFLASLVSRLIGVHLPGENAIIHSISMRFRKPVIVGDTIEVSGEVEQVSESTRTVVVKTWIEEMVTHTLCADGRVQVGLTEEQGRR
jgi:acyl dehydratase